MVESLNFLWRLNLESTSSLSFSRMIICSDKASLTAATCFSWPARRPGASLVEESFTRREEFSEAASRIAALTSASLAISQI